MEFEQDNELIVIRLWKDEEILSSLTEFCNSHQINAGWISGIGAAEKIIAGYYDFIRKEYVWKEFEGVHEIVPLTGNISQIGEKVFLHLHINFTDHDLSSYGGHLKSAIVNPTLEVIVCKLTRPLVRFYDIETGLYLLKLSNNNI
ncbi:MAG TPA: DNA-binding protein [Bacteroidales bacterium]|nr:DNA-binding protein [Bacteroidales bacterium]HQF18129.1 DNA-binding protein [Bacteroidales bacterium]